MSHIPLNNSIENYDIKDVPENIKSNFIEAIKDYDNRCYASCMVMIRRTFQKSTRDIIFKNSIVSKNDSLHAELTLLSAQGIITKSNFEAYIANKNVGNKGAHPNDDPDLDLIAQQDCIDAIEITLLFFIEVYKSEALRKQIINNAKALK